MSTCGAKVGLVLPRRIAAITDARRPSVLPSASTMNHSRLISPASAKTFVAPRRLSPSPCRAARRSARRSSSARPAHRRRNRPARVSIPPAARCHPASRRSRARKQFDRSTSAGRVPRPISISAPAIVPHHLRQKPVRHQTRISTSVPRRRPRRPTRARSRRPRRRTSSRTVPVDGPACSRTRNALATHRQTPRNRAPRPAAPRRPRIGPRSTSGARAGQPARRSAAAATRSRSGTGTPARSRRTGRETRPLAARRADTATSRGSLALSACSTRCSAQGPVADRRRLTT